MCPILLDNYTSNMTFSLVLHAKLFKIHGFQNPLLKNHGFHGTHGTHANAATVICVKSEKYAILLTLRPHWSMEQD